jgi:pimeloyl-ACP methyl ester carboxylesterase
MKCIFFSLCLLVVSIHLNGQKIQYGDNPAAGKYYNVRGIKVYTEEYGKGKPLVLIHGNGGSISSMSSIIPFFSEKFRTIIPDSRAHGKSTDPGDSLSFEMMADDVASLLDQMKIDSAYIIGWSDGGIIALVTAMRHPGKVRRLVSTGANLWPDSTALEPAIWKEEKKYYDSQRYKLKITHAEKNEWKIFMLDWEQPDIKLSSLKKIKAPSLIICGDHDLIRIEHTVEIFRNIPGAKLWVIPDSGHATLIEHQEEFCKGVDQFLK